MGVYRRSSRRRWRIWRRWIFTLVVAGAAVIAYLLWREHSDRLALKKAETEAAPDAATTAEAPAEPATPGLKVSAQGAPFNRDQLVIAADLLDQINSRDALTLRRQLSDPAPTDAPARLALAKTALRLKDPASAKGAVDIAPEVIPPAQAARLHLAMAALSDVPHERDTALSALSAESPTDASVEFELAELKLLFPETAAAARATLTKFTESGPLQDAARRTLAEDAARRRVPSEMLQWIRAIMSQPSVTFGDRLLQLNLERALNAGDADQHLVALQRLAKTSDDVTSLAVWMILKDDAADAARWLDALSPELRDSAAVRDIRTLTAVVHGQWDDAKTLLAAGAWGRIAPKTLDLVGSERVLRESNRDTLADQIWTEALASTDNSPATLGLMYRLALAEHNARNIEATLRLFMQQTPPPLWALRTLLRKARADRDTSAMRDLFTQWMQMDPTNRRIRVRWATTSLLTDTGTPSSAVKNATAEAVSADAHNPDYVLARALTLWRDGQSDKARALLETLNSDQLLQPRTALIYGALLSEVKPVERARPYLEVAAKATLLPEETVILRQAQTRAKIKP